MEIRYECNRISNFHSLKSATNVETKKTYLPGISFSAKVISLRPNSASSMLATLYGGFDAAGAIVISTSQITTYGNTRMQLRTIYVFTLTRFTRVLYENRLAAGSLGRMRDGPKGKGDPSARIFESTIACDIHQHRCSFVTVIISY